MLWIRCLYYGRDCKEMKGSHFFWKYQVHICYVDDLTILYKGNVP